MHEARNVMVTFEGAQILDVTGPVEVFSTASRFLPSVSYRTEVVSSSGGLVGSSCGIAVATSPISDVDGDVDTLLVAGGADMDVPGRDEALVEEVRRLTGRARRVASVCSGAFLLARCGLLAGRRATTHWAECRMLADAYPDVRVDPDALYVRDGQVWTSAGVTAGIDLALALLAEDHGPRAAATAARQLVVHLRRSGGQSQYSRQLAAQAVATEPVRDVLAWLPDHLADDLTVPALADRAHLSERHFRRVFKAEVGANPVDYVEELRVDAACTLLETTTHAIADIARRCGFGTTETMDRAFRRRRGTTPTQHRHHFGAEEPVGVRADSRTPREDPARGRSPGRR